MPRRRKGLRKRRLQRRLRRRPGLRRQRPKKMRASIARRRNRPRKKLKKKPKEKPRSRLSKKRRRKQNKKLRPRQNRNSARRKSVNGRQRKIRRRRNWLKTRPNKPNLRPKSKVSSLRSNYLPQHPPRSPPANLSSPNPMMPQYNNLNLRLHQLCLPNRLMALLYPPAVPRFDLRQSMLTRLPSPSYLVKV